VPTARPAACGMPPVPLHWPLGPGPSPGPLRLQCSNWPLSHWQCRSRARVTVPAVTVTVARPGPAALRVIGSD
jgi:hypothetical protein